NTGNYEWYTPLEYIEAARETMGSIGTDPASSEIANKTILAKRYHTKEENGLTKEWKGNIWLNPPYAQPLVSEFCGALVDKFKSGEIKQAVVLVNNATETKYFQKMLEVCSAICLVKKRIKFLSPEGKRGSPLQGQVILYFGPNTVEFNRQFANFGSTAWKK
ncbi:MAG: DNA N-6-adenine-methyltransferase, partial [Patescibacteria group bacterium]